MWKGRYSANNPGTEGPVVSNFNKKLEYLQIVEKHTEYYILKTGQGLYKASIPADLKVFDIITARILSNSPLKLNLNDLSGYSNSSALAKDICIKLKLEKPLQIKIVRFLLINKQIVTYDIIKSLTKIFEPLKFSSQLDFNFALLGEVSTKTPGTTGTQQTTQISGLINQLFLNDGVLPRFDNSPEISSEFMDYLMNPGQYLSTKITGTVFDDIYVNNCTKMVNNYLKLMTKQTQHIIPILYKLNSEKAEYRVLSFISGDISQKIYTLLFVNDSVVGRFVLFIDPQPSMLVDSVLFSNIGHFCTTEQKSHLPKTSMLDNLNGYTSELFRFDMSLFEDVFNSEPVDLTANAGEPATDNVAIKSVKLVSLYMETIKIMILGGVL